MTTWPCACTTIINKNLKILKTEVISEEQNQSQGEIVNITKEGITVATGNGLLLLKEVKPEGKPKMNAYDWTNGAKIKIGDKFE